MERLAYSYSRWSTAEQSKGDSKRRQREAFDRFCKSHDLTPDRSAPMIDAGRSAYKGAHLKGTGRLGKFLDAAKRGDIPPNAVLVVENIDRLTPTHVVRHKTS